MLSWIREKFGKVVIGGIISFIAFVFIFSGVFSPKATRGLHEGSVAGTVNGDAISIAEFNREVNQRIELFRSYMGEKITDEQLKAFRIKESVFQSLVNRKLMLQEAMRQNLQASDEEVKVKIQEIPAFQKEGQFDFLAYKQILQANNYSAGSFEKAVRDDLTAQQWANYFKNRVHFSDEELRKSFALAETKKDLKYVLIPTDSFKESIQKEFKLDSKAPLSSEHMTELQKRTLDFAKQVSEVLNVDLISDNKTNLLLKPYQLKVQKSEKITQQNSFIPSIGDIKEITRDAFAASSPIDPKQGGKAKVYSMAGRFVVAIVSGSTQADFTRFEAEKVKLAQNLLNQKYQSIQQEWIKKLTEKAKIESNASVISEKESD